ncbi:MAG: protein-L-isoaspartate O-methyltransferase [Crocinitomicaceae bacterium]|nr:protein-L-isoaspartate O-methyltransferase [Crocinitomicaceae bacterium]|tara:strand:+ start:13944 stop:14585 length:642 start_codon:yes stop_codon:yes gene_type:complete
MEIKFKGLCSKLIIELKSKGIKDQKVLDAISVTPRHLLFDPVFRDKFAYQDIAFPIGENQTISQPYTVAFQTELLAVSRGSKVLEIGTGSGYQTAVLCQLGAKVFSIERHKSLFKNAKLFLNQNNYRAQLFFGDGFIGKKVFAPYDRIIVTCGAPFVPNDLKSQLKVGGRMVIPVGEGEVQQMKLIQRLNEDDFKETNFGDFRFVPMLKNINN